MVRSLAVIRGPVHIRRNSPIPLTVPWAGRRAIASSHSRPVSRDRDRECAACPRPSWDRCGCCDGSCAVGEVHNARDSAALRCGRRQRRHSRLKSRACAFIQKAVSGRPRDGFPTPALQDGRMRRSSRSKSAALASNSSAMRQRASAMVRSRCARDRSSAALSFKKSMSSSIVRGQHRCDYIGCSSNCVLLCYVNVRLHH